MHSASTAVLVTPASKCDEILWNLDFHTYLYRHDSYFFGHFLCFFMFILKAWSRSCELEGLSCSRDTHLTEPWNVWTVPQQQEQTQIRALSAKTEAFGSGQKLHFHLLRAANTSWQSSSGCIWSCWHLKWAAKHLSISRCNLSLLSAPWKYVV